MSFTHPQDTATTVRVLCQAHLQLREVYFQEMEEGEPDIYVGPAKDSPSERARQELTATIGALLATLPSDKRFDLLPEVLMTHEDCLISHITMPAPGHQLVRDKWLVGLLIPLGAEAFRQELDFGLTPPLQDFDFIFDALMEKLRASSGRDDLWYENCRRYLMRASPVVIGSILDYADNEDDLPGDLSVFLAELLEARVQQDHASALRLCEGAMFASCTFKIGALIMAGLRPPKFDEAIFPNSREVNDLLTHCASQHGRLELTARLGPLHHYLKTSPRPDLSRPGR